MKYTNSFFFKIESYAEFCLECRMGSGEYQEGDDYAVCDISCSDGESTDEENYMAVCYDRVWRANQNDSDENGADEDGDE